MDCWTRHASVVTAAMLLVSYGMPASAAVVSFSDDTSFSTNAKFEKYFGANVRWGAQPPEANRTWEYGIVTDKPVTTSFRVYDQKEFVYPSVADGSANHWFSFSYWAFASGSHNAGDASLDIMSVGASGNDDSLKDVSTFVNGREANALAIRAKAESGRTSTLFDPITVNFHSGGSVTLGSLVGDANAQYLMLVDDRLADGFTVTGSARLLSSPGYDGDRAAYQFKVGTSHIVPLPAAVWLLGAGFLGYLGLAGSGRFSA